MALSRKRRAATMHAALYNNRERRLARIDANSGPAPLVLAMSYNNIFSRGDRRLISLANKGNSFITATSVVSMPTENVPFTDGFDGNEATDNNGPAFSSGSLTSGVSALTWTCSEAIAIAALKFPQGDIGDLGMWNLDGSNDGSTWHTLVGSPFHWNMTSTGFDGAHRGCVALFTNTTKYTHYRLCYVSGSFSGNRLCSEFIFGIMSHPVLAAGFATVSSSMDPRNSRTVADLQDGLLSKSFPSTGPDQVSLTTPPTDGTGYIKFDFGVGNKVNIHRFRFNTDGQANDWGTWKWKISDDDITYTDSGAVFAFNPTVAGNTLWDAIINGAGASGDKARYWKMVCVTFPGGAMNGMYEFVFDLGET